jgi:hypothetical protein
MKINPMTINREELVFLGEERKINLGYVFLEKSDRPTSNRGGGIPAGILMLTNRRLFFFDSSIHKSRLKTAGKIAGTIAAKIAGEFTFGLAEIAHYGIEIGIEKWNESKSVDLEPFLDKKDSFVIPIERIVSCEKFGSMLSLMLKNVYTRIGMMNDAGATTYYCIYCKNPHNSQETVNKKWFDKINEARVGLSARSYRI